MADRPKTERYDKGAREYGDGNCAEGDVSSSLPRKAHHQVTVSTVAGGEGDIQGSSGLSHCTSAAMIRVATATSRTASHRVLPEFCQVTSMYLPYIDVSSKAKRARAISKSRAWASFQEAQALLSFPSICALGTIGCSVKERQRSPWIFQR